ncbi:MAG: preprotein translocase subunit SecA, partial [Candidatus Omnitrophica bacterium]|nr:preprotein translocase subunit SecA [Candidatus Omnitrophota bacterium]
MIGSLGKWFKRIFGTQNDREIRKLAPMVARINSLESKYVEMSDDRIKTEAASLRASLRASLGEIQEDLKELRERAVTSASEQDKNRYKKKIVEAKNKAMEKDLPDVFAMVREASKRTTGLRHFDVQLMGGLVLHYGKIAEMATGEGKTLVATLPVALNALAEGNVHVVTVNDYLAKRDSEWMGPIYRFLGLTVGVIQHDMRPQDRKSVYACDVVYGTNNEFGFDYLRDNMVVDTSDLVQREPVYAVVDEVDSILVDEARTPLIISGPVDETNEAYNEMRPVVQEIVAAQRKLVREYLSEIKPAMAAKDTDKAGRLLYLVHKAEPKNREFLDMILKDMSAKTLLDKAQGVYDTKVMEKEKDELLEALYYIFDEKGREATISARGQKMLKERFGIEFMLEDIEGRMAELAEQEMAPEEKAAKEAELIAAYTAQQKNVESIKQLLKAFILFQKDVDYVVKDNKIMIVDEFTGRMMPGRRFSDGIHEAIEAKERVEVQRESQTLATITLQNYFRMYDKLAGMTGTAKTEEAEFESIYLLPVVQVPTNRELKRQNMPDRIYKTEREKFNAVVEEIAEANSKGRPVLVGTVSIEKSERLSKLLTDKGV